MSAPGRASAALGAVMALMLAAPAWAAPSARPAPAAPAPARAEATPWDDLDARLASNDWKGVAEASDALIADKARSTLHAGAWARLGRALQLGGFDYAALASYREAIRLDPKSAAAFYPYALDLADALDDDAWLGSVIGADFGVPMDEALRSRVALAAARSEFARGSWVQTTSLLPLVSASSPQHLDAEVLRGVALAQNGKYEDALIPLLTSYEDARRAKRDRHFVNTLSLNIARTFFAAGNFAQAMAYYDQVDRDDPSWAEAFYERAWAHFRIDDMNGTLALLMVHGSPFFAEDYFPEADLLRAQAFFLLCYFPEAKKAIDAFQAHYTPVRDTLRATVGTLDPASALADARAAAGGGTTRLPPSLMERFAHDDRLADTLKSLTRADGELARLTDGPWAERARALLQERRDARATSEGQRVLDIAAEARDQLTEMLSDIELTRVDLLTYQSDLYTQAIGTGTTQILEDPAGRLRALHKKGKEVWPFDDEYWADEVGYYHIDAGSACPTKLQRGQ